MKLSLKKLSLSWLVMAGIALAQPLTPAETNERVVKLSQALGGPVGAVLDSPEAVWVVAGLRPEYSAFVGDLQVRGDLTEAAYQVLGSRDLEVSYSESVLRVRSVEGLRATTSRSQLSDIVVFDGDQSEWEAWRSSQLERLAKAHPSQENEVVELLLAGAPDGVLQTLLASSDDSLAESRALDVVVPYAQDFLTIPTHFEVLPEHLTPEFREWRNRLVRFSADYYSQNAVISRFRSADWQSARRQVFPEVSDRSPAENYYQGTVHEFSHLRFGRDTEQEILLSDHAKIWADSIRVGDPPSSWVRSFVVRAADAGFSQPLDEDDLKDWIWDAALAFTPAQRLVYDAVRETYPDYYPTQSAQRIENWLEVEELLDSPEARESRAVVTATLLGHPNVKEFYSKAPLEVKQSISRYLKAYGGVKEVRPLLETAPYAL